MAPVGCQPQGPAASLQAAYSQHRPCGARVPAEAGPNFAGWWAGVHVCEQLTQGCYAVCLGRGSNSRPSDRESRALTNEPPRRGGLSVCHVRVLCSNYRRYQYDFFYIRQLVSMSLPDRVKIMLACIVTSVNRFLPKFCPKVTHPLLI